MLKEEVIIKNIQNQSVKEINKKLEEYTQLIDDSIQCLLIFQDNQMVLGNKRITEITGYDLDEIYNVKKERLAELFYFEDETEDLWETIKDLTLNNGPSKESEACFIHKDGSKHWMGCYFVPITYQNQPAVQVSFIDITKRKKAEKKAEKKEEELRAVQKLSKVANFNVELGTSEIKWTPEFFKIIECDPKSFENTVSSFHRLIHPYDLEFFKQSFGDGMHLENFKFEHRLLMPDGRTKDVISHGSLNYSEDGKPSNFLGYMQDITEIKNYERKLTAAIDEKELLLREVHHRVKNNLQIITSLINLQSIRETKNPDDTLRNIQSKIRSMALIHEKLYQSPELTRVNIKEYIKTFTVDVFNLYDVKYDKINLNTEMEDLEVGIDTAIPLGLIINEILTNVIKYAFPQDEKGIIKIRLYSQEKNIILEIGDNGIGMPETVNIENPETLGLTIISSLTTQLDGTLKLTKNPGTSYKITFKEQHYKKRT